MWTRTGLGTQIAAVVASGGIVITVLCSTLPPRAASGTNEASAIATMRASAADVTASASIDTHCDGKGEHGFLVELAGTIPIRVCQAGVRAAGVVGVDELDPPLLARHLGNICGSIAEHAGYQF